MKHIAIFASGNGSNAENVITYMRTHSCNGSVALVLSNRTDAGVLSRAEALGVPTIVLSRAQINDPDTILPILAKYHIDIIVLAGFLLMIPPFLIERYCGKMVNIHPSLLPKFGGKGMFGRHVHEAVVAAGEKETGITIHLVSERYDEGRILFQAKVDVDIDDTPDDVERKVRDLESSHFPQVIASFLL